MQLLAICDFEVAAIRVTKGVSIGKERFTSFAVREIFRRFRSSCGAELKGADGPQSSVSCKKKRQYLRFSAVSWSFLYFGLGLSL